MTTAEFTDAIQSDRTRRKNRPRDERRAYKAWHNMIRRTTNPACRCYKNYGARGITVDPAWLSFPQYLRDMGPMAEGMSLERRDVNGPYAKWNCTYIPRAEQARNTRKNIWLTCGDRTALLIDWARELGVHPGRIKKYAVDLGVPMERLVAGDWDAIRDEFAKPKSGGRPAQTYEYKGEQKTLCELSAIGGVEESRIYSRLQLGWSVEQAVESPKNVTRKTAVEIDGRLNSVAGWCRELNVSRNSYERLVGRGLSGREALLMLRDTDAGDAEPCPHAVLLVRNATSLIRTRAISVRESLARVEERAASHPMDLRAQGRLERLRSEYAFLEGLTIRYGEGASRSQSPTT